MNLAELAKSLWDEFVSLFKKPEAPQAVQPFSRCTESGDWRTGRSTWVGILAILKNRTYYLECQPVSLADKRELGLSPPPTHTFKLFYFSEVNGQRVRTTVFCCYLNCVIPRSTLVPDWVATEILSKRIAQHVQIISVRSRVETPGSSDKLETEVVNRPGELSLIKVKGDNTIPSIVLLSRTYPERTQAYWQGFLDAELERVKLEATERSR